MIESGECCGCLKVAKLISVGFQTMYGHVDVPLCLECRVSIDPHEYGVTPDYYWKHMRTVVQQAKECQPV